MTTVMMSTILIREEIGHEELGLLMTEFPQLELIRLPAGENLASLGIERLAQVEIFYGSTLSAQEFPLLPHLHWIHCPKPYLDQIAFEASASSESLLISTTKEANIDHTAEFALASLLSFSKNLFSWLQSPYDVDNLRARMWAAKEKSFLQVGLGVLGSEIAKKVSEAGFKVTGVSDPASFHPCCEVTHPTSALKELLPQFDIVSLTMPRDHSYEPWFSSELLSLLKEDALLLLFGSGSVVKLTDLKELLLSGRLRGAVIDAHFSNPKHLEELRGLPNALVTFESAGYPIEKNHQSFQDFLYNLRQFLHGNYADMKSLFTQLNPPQ